MNSIVQIEQIWQNYLRALDSFKVVKKAYGKKEFELLRKTQFYNMSKDDFDNWYEASSENSRDFCILTMWAVFEAELIEFIQRKSDIVKSIAPKPFAVNLSNKVENSIEYWSSDERLDLIKTVIDPNIIGQAKQIKEYRDYIAHRRKEPSASVDPKTAYLVLKNVLDELHKN